MRFCHFCSGVFRSLTQNAVTPCPVDIKKTNFENVAVSVDNEMDGEKKLNSSQRKHF